MIVQCPACRALVGVTAFVRVTDDESGTSHAGIRCSECHATTTLPFADTSDEGAPSRAAPSSSSRVVVVEASESRAPASEGDSAVAPATKEGTAAPTGALHHVVVRALSTVLVDVTPTSADAGDEGDGGADPGSFAPLVDATRKRLVDALLALGDRWEQKDAHKGIVGEAARVDELAFLGQCYRAVVLAKPNDVGATAGRDLVIAHAMATMSGGVRESDGVVVAAKQVKVFALAAAAVILFIAVAFMLRHMGDAMNALSPPPSTTQSR